MKTETSPQEIVNRRQFLLQAAAVGGARATPVSLLGQAEAVASSDAVETTGLLQGWSLKSIEPQADLTAEFLSQAGPAATGDGWLPVASMPAMVHDVLLAQGKSEEPWLRGGTEKCFCTGERDWVYGLKVSARPGRMSRLRFLGLDGRAEVYLNGARVASHSDEHAPLTVEVRQALRPENSLVLRFRSNAGRSQEAAPETGRQRPGGSYLGPNPALTSVGIFDQLWLETSDGNTLDEAAMWALEDYNKDFTDRGPWTGLAAAEEVGAICQQLDPERYYQPSSPYGGVNHNDPREGNTHGYSNMWFVPGYDYLNLHGNRHPFPKTWLPCTCAGSWKKTGPVEQFYDATVLAGLVHRIGMAEGLYYQDIVERQRRGRPAEAPSERRCCGGYLVWKYNDSWPQIYSAEVDFFLEPYHAYHALRRAFAPVMLSFDIGTFLYLWVVNDCSALAAGVNR